MGNDKNLSVNNMVELAMGLSMASLFNQAMNNTMANTQRMLNNDQVAAPPKYIHAIVGGVQKGPYSLGEIVSLIQAGDITPETYIWKPGMAEWKLAKDVDDVGPTLNAPTSQAPETVKL